MTAPNNTAYLATPSNVGTQPLSRLGWTSAPNQRGSIDIIWSCVLALFVCVWAVLHHNIPARTDGYWRMVRRKLRWACLAVCAPELLTLFAVMQWHGARLSVTQMRELGDEDWSIVHGFYANAGGFILVTPGFPPFPINATSIVYLRKTGRINPLTITRDDIWDRSKADLFAKGFAIVQTCWVLIQCIARAAQGLAVTPIELFTVAFLVPTIATSFFWANKPQNVEEPSVIVVNWRISELLISEGESAKEPYVDTPLDFIEKPVWQGWNRRRRLLHFGGLERRPLVRIPNDYSPPPPTGKEALFVWVISVVHAAVHIAGWDFEFPTYAELLLWRISTVILLGVMVIGGAVPVISTREWFDFTFNLLWIWVREARKPTWFRRHLFNFIVDITYIVYILARLIIFVQIFISFRSLPASAYDDVSWTAFLPHV